MAEQSVTRVRLRNVRASYPHVFNPKEDDKGNKKYQLSCILNRDDKFYAENKAAVDKAIAHLLDVAGQKLNWKKDGAGKWKVPSTFKIPLRDGDEKSDEAYENADYFNASSTNKPNVVDKALKPITEDSGDFYAGCYCHVSVNFFLFDLPESKGIAAGLENIMKSKDGQKLSGGRSAAEDFADLADDDDDDDDDFKPL